MTTLSSFMAMDPEEGEASALRNMWRAVETAVDTIARARRTAEILHDISPEEFDKKLNEICEKAYRHFSVMDKTEMAVDMLLELMQRHAPGDLEELFK